MTNLSREEARQIAIAEDERFTKALVELVLAWSDAEHVLFKLLAKYAGVETGVAHALFSGVRCDGAITFLRAIAANVAIEKARVNDMEDVFKHLNAISTMRNYLTHHVNGSQVVYSDVDPTMRTLTNKRRVSRFQSVWNAKINALSVENMCADLTECCWRLIAHLDNSNKPFEPGCGPTGKRKPWLYKPIQLNTSFRPPSPRIPK